MAFIYAYDTRTGEKLRVPEQWVDLFDHISKTPRQKAADKPATPKSKSATPIPEPPADGDTKEETPHA